MNITKSIWSGTLHAIERYHSQIDRIIIMIVRSLRQRHVQASVGTALSRMPHTTTLMTRAEFGDLFAKRWYRSSSQAMQAKKTVPIIYIEPDGKEHEVQAEVGKNLLDIAHDNNIELEGACGGELACATCHLIFEEDLYETLPEKKDEEDDMLDLAFELTETSRLGCQIVVNESFSGAKIRIPDDGY